MLCVLCVMIMFFILLLPLLDDHPTAVIGASLSFVSVVSYSPTIRQAGCIEAVGVWSPPFFSRMA